jgi:hypothetical protein
MPEAILVEIAAAIAAKAAESLYDLVKQKLTRSKKALATLDAADGAAPDSAEVLALAAELETAEAYDEEFGQQLRAQWEALRNGAATPGGTVVNTVSGNVKGSVLQARDIHGNITIGGADGTQSTGAIPCA